MRDAYTADDFKRLLADVCPVAGCDDYAECEHTFDDVLAAFTTLRAERDEVLTRMREMDEVIGRRNQAVLRLQTELGEERSLRMNTERDRDGYREGSRRLEAERDELRGELADARRSHEFTRQWYAERIERIRDLAKEHGIWPEAACILANGTAAASEPPTYAQILNGERHKHKRAAAERNRYRTALERIAEQDEPLGWEAQDALKGGSDE